MLTIRFYGGVGTLVALSLAVTAGLLASDRVLLGPRRRMWAQSAHRTLGVLTVLLLTTHLITEIIAHHISAVAAAVPLLAASLYLGLGSAAAYLMLIAMWTGLIRARFAGNGHPGLWRVLHAAGYLSWPIALLHGLRGGRPPADWVVASYLVLLTVVGIALGVRLGAERRHQRARDAGAMLALAQLPASHSAPGLPAARRSAPAPIGAGPPTALPVPGSVQVRAAARAVDERYLAALRDTSR